MSSSSSSSLECILDNYIIPVYITETNVIIPTFTISILTIKNYIEIIINKIINLLLHTNIFHTNIFHTFLITLWLIILVTNIYKALIFIYKSIKI
jgi:hypothetical protein